MAKRKEGVDKQLLQSAKREFLRNGYNGASLRKIAENAGTSTAAIYVRYENKQNLFKVLVESTSFGFMQLLRECLENVHSGNVDCTDSFYREHYQQSIPIMLNYIYCHFEEFKLLTMCGESNMFRRYIYDLALIELEYVKRTIDTIPKNIPDDLRVMIHQSFYMGLFELVIHDIPKENADKLGDWFFRYYMGCWHGFM